PDAVRAALGAEIAGLRPLARGVAWVAAENLHVTLKFLGEVDPDRLDRVAAALATVASGRAPFDLVVEGLGAFPSATRPRVVWAGLARGAHALAALAVSVEDALAGLGFAREARPFASHVTLGRAREPRPDPSLARAIGVAASRAFGAARVDRVTLMGSELHPRGARYTALGAWPFPRLQGERDDPPSG
ncbi:MAG: RNA 2',3'-cyclic phosphodiesterase, partial [Candidatus Rokubacteria bacterium]|nr:RNA 2',3'-cyclic phosphodiesterase [Candidatus Rokubacteria bacterium]